MTKAEKKEIKKRFKLANAAGLSMYEFNTSVVQSEDNTFRAGVRSGMTPYGDMVSLQIMFEKEPGIWNYSHMTPANARVLAYHLKRMADILEKKVDTF